MKSIPREKILDTVKQLVLNEIGESTVKVYLFGSWARGEQHRSSDIDIAVDWPGGAPSGKLARLREVLEESYIPYRVDVFDLAEAAAELVDKVRKEGVLWKG